VEIAGRSFGIGCQLELERLAPYGCGIELAPLVGVMDTFPSKTGWFTRVRRPLVPLMRLDATMLHRKLRSVATKPELAIGGYVAQAGSASVPASG
jgi:hypothetical protein